MVQFTILATTCQVLQQELAQAQAALSAAQNALSAAQKDLDAKIKAAYTPGWTGSKEDKLEIDRLTALLKSAQTRYDLADSAMSTAKSNFDKSGLTLCNDPPPCTPAISHDIFSPQIPDNLTSDTTALEAKKKILEEDIAEIKKQLDDIKACTNANFDYTSLEYRPTPAPGFWYSGGDPKNPQDPLNNQQLIDKIGSKGPNGNRCIPDEFASEYYKILTNKSSWDTHPGNPVWWTLPKRSRDKIASIDRKLAEWRQEEIATLEEKLSKLQEELLDINLKIKDYKDPKSQINRTKRGSILSFLLNTILRCASDLQYKNTVTVTADAGPMATGTGGVSITKENHSSVKTTKDGVISLDVASAASLLPSPGGCGKDGNPVNGALWVYPVVVTAVVTVDIAKAQQCIQSSIPVKAADYDLIGGDSTISTNSNGSVTLTGCIGKPK